MCLQMLPSFISCSKGIHSESFLGKQLSQHFNKQTLIFYYYHTVHRLAAFI